jgi:hypothetical protein
LAPSLSPSPNANHAIATTKRDILGECVVKPASPPTRFAAAPTGKQPQPILAHVASKIVIRINIAPLKVQPTLMLNACTKHALPPMVQRPILGPTSANVVQLVAALVKNAPLPTLTLSVNPLKTHAKPLMVGIQATHGVVNAAKPFVLPIKANVRRLPIHVWSLSNQKSMPVKTEQKLPKHANAVTSRPLLARLARTVKQLGQHAAQVR